MSYYVELPNGDIIEVPDDVSQAEAKQKIYKAYPQFAPKPDESKSGFIPALQAGFKGLKGDVAALAGRTGVMDVGAAEKYIAEQQKQADKIFQPTQDEWSESPWKKIKELAGGSAAYMAAPALAGVATLALPASVAPAVATGIGLGLTGLVSGAQFAGSGLTRQVEEGTPLAQTDLTAAALAAIPQAALDVVSLKMIPGVRGIFGAAGKKMTAEQAEAIATQGLKKTVADYALSTGTAMGAEGLTEAAQQVFERLQAGLSLTDEKAQKEYLDSFLGGAILGGAISPAGRYLERGREQREAEVVGAMPGQRPGESLADAAQRLKTEIDEEKLSLNPPVPPVDPNATPLMDKEALGMVLDSENGYGKLDNYKRALMAMPQTDEIKNSIAEVKELQAASNVNLVYGQVADKLSQRPEGDAALSLLPADLSTVITPELANTMGLVQNRFKNNIFNQIVGKDMSVPADVNTVRSVLESYIATAKPGDTPSKIATFLKSIPPTTEIAPESVNVGTTDTAPGGESTVVASEPGAGTAPAGVGTTESSGVVSTGEDATGTVGGEAAAPPPVITQSAKDLLESIDVGGGTPAFMTNKLKQIAADNGIEVLSSDTPNSVIDKIRDKVKPPAAKPEILEGGMNKSQWVDSLLGQNRIAKENFGITLDVTPAGKLIFNGDIRKTKQGKAFAASLEAAYKAGATEKEIVAAIQSAPSAPVKEYFSKRKPKVAPKPKAELSEVEKQDAEAIAAFKAEGPARIAEKTEQIKNIMGKILSRMGLKDVAVKIMDDIESKEAGGSYSAKLIKIALDEARPVRTLRHEAIHALKELGFFSESQWNTLVKQAKEGWIDTYLKSRDVNGEPLQEGEKSRYDIYMERPEFKSDPNAIIEEAIADAFGDFDTNGAPPGMLKAILNRLISFFDAIKSALQGNGIYTSEQAARQVFGKITRGELKATAREGSITSGAQSGVQSGAQRGEASEQARSGEPAVRPGDRGGEGSDGRDEEKLSIRKAGDSGGVGRGREAVVSASPLQGSPSVPSVNGPDPRIVEVAERYAREHGIDLKRQSEYVEVSWPRGKRLADAYEAMQHNPQDPAVKAAYKDLIKQTTAQYLALEKAGYKFWFIDFAIPSNEAYINTPWNSIRDLRNNKEMGVFPTTSGFGSSDLDVADNPLLVDTGIKWPNGGVDGELKNVLANDLFRAVHDAFGHGIEGAGFRWDGEENAWQAHARLYTGPALHALTSETRGQNSQVNFGKDGEFNRTASGADTIFADQKVGLMPDWTWKEGISKDEPVFQELDSRKDAKMFRNAVDRVKRGREYAFPLHVHDLETYQDARLFLSEDKESGFALIGDEIGSFFSGGGGQAYPTLRLAVEEGGRRIDAYRTKLPSVLGKAQFRPVARVEFNPEMATELWDFEKFKQFQNGNPDLVFYAYDSSFNPKGDLKAGDEAVAQTPLVEYEQAVELQVAATKYSLRGITLGTKQQDSVASSGVHYGKAKTDTLDASKYGTGLRGAESRRLETHWDNRIKKRVYFYIAKPDGTMPLPESGLGGYVYTQTFDNLAPPSVVSKLYSEARGDANTMESLIVDAGYDGYAVPKMGMMVVLNQNTPVEYQGTKAEYESKKQEKLSLRSVPLSTRGIMEANDAFARSELGLKTKAVRNRFNKVRDIAIALNRETLENQGQMNRKELTTDDLNTISRALADEVSYQLLSSSKTGTGLGWYSNNYPKAVKKLAKRFPELETNQHARAVFSALVAVTSNGEKVTKNISNAITLYAKLRDGKPLVAMRNRRATALINNLKQIEMLLAKYDTDFEKELKKEVTVADMNAYLRSVGKKADASYLANTRIPAAAIYFGPKLGAFYANLSGSEGYLTMDLWWTRTFNRMRGLLIPHATDASIDKFREMIGKPNATRDDILAEAVPLRDKYKQYSFNTELEHLVGKKEPDTKAGKIDWVKRARVVAEDAFDQLMYDNRLEKMANTIYKNEYEMLQEAPFSSSDRKFMYDAARRTQKLLQEEKINLSLADIQAALWYYEKRLYGKLSGKKADDIGYEEAIIKQSSEGRGRTRLSVVFDRGVDTGNVSGGKSGTPDEVGRVPSGSTEKLSLRVPGYLYHRSNLEKLASVENGDKFVLQPGPQGAEGEGVYFSQDEVVRETTAEGTTRKPQTAVVVIKTPLRDGWYVSKTGKTIKYGKPRTWHTENKTIDLQAVDVKTIEGEKVIFAKPISSWVNAQEKLSLRAPDTKEFKQFFGDSKVVDENGEPLVMYTGTSKDLDFTKFKIPKNGVWFLSDPKLASDYALENDSQGYKYDSDKNEFVDKNTASRVIPVFLNITNPATLSEADKLAIRKSTNYRKVQGEIFDRFRAKGYDGVDFGEGLWVVIGTPNQIKSATGNIGTYDKKNPDIRYSLRDKLGLYSELENKIEAVGPNQAPAPQWKAMIKGMVQKGVKPEEIEWSGVNDYLDLQEGKVSKAALLEYLKEGGVKVEETTLGDSQFTQAMSKRLDELEENNDRTDEEDLERQKLIRLENLTANVTTKYNRDDLNLILPGGTNYREVLLTLPETKPSVNNSGWTAKLLRLKSPITAMPEFEISDANGNVVSVIRTAKDSKQAIDLAASQLYTKQKRSANYKSAHWDQLNVLAHIRINDRVDVDGKKVLFVEEVQSDWGQQGKREGFGDSNIKPVSRKDFDVYVDKLLDDYKAYLVQSGKDRQGVERLVDHMTWPEMAQELGRADEYTRMRAGRDMDMVGKTVIPVAPFVTKTEGWLNLALKRIMVIAAEGNYDKVAFINGKQSAQRYNLAAYIDTIDYEKDDQGTYEFVATDKEGKTVYEKEEMSLFEIEGLVGKDIAKKIEAGEGEKSNNASSYRDWHTLSNVDLEVGEGKGMKVFYDQIVPIALKKLLPKVGGKSLNEVNINLNALDSRQILAKQFGVADSYSPQPGFDVTPEMKQKVETTGLPKFSLRRAYSPQWTNERIDSLLRQYAFTQNGREGDTQAYAVSIKPKDFLDATSTKEYRKVLETQRTPLDVDKLKNEVQPIYLSAEQTEEGIFKIEEHDGRHRMMALRDAGVEDQVPVVLVLRPYKIIVKDASIIEEPYFKPQVFGKEKAPKGFYSSDAIPISYKHKKDLQENFGRESDIKFSLRTIDLEKSKRMDEALRGKPYVEALDLAIKKATDAGQRSILEKVKVRYEDLKARGFEFKFALTPVNKQLTGKYGVVELTYKKLGSPTQIEMTVNGFNDNQSSLNPETLAHEFVHTVTAAQIAFVPDSGPTRDLYKLYDDVVTHFNEQYKSGKLDKELEADIRIWIADPDELIAYGLTSPNAQNWLASIQDKSGKTWLSKLFDVISKVLNLTGAEKSVLARLMTVSEDIFTEELTPQTEKANLRGLSFGKQENTTGKPTWTLGQGDLAWVENNIALFTAKSMIGDKTLYVASKEGQGQTRVDIRKYTGTMFTPEELTRLKDKADELSSAPQTKFSLRSTWSPSMNAAIDRTSVARIEEGWAARLLSAISPKNFSEYRQVWLNRYNQLGVYDKMRADRMGGYGLLADASAEAAAMMSDYGAGLTAAVFSKAGGVPVFANGMTTVSTLNGTIKGPLEIFSELTKLGKGDSSIYRAYQLWAGVKRGKRLMPSKTNPNGTEVNYTPADIADAKKFCALDPGDPPGLYPEFANVQKEWIKYNNQLAKYLVDTGVISGKARAEWIKYADYIPFYRQVDDEQTLGPKLFQSLTGVKPPKKLKGGSTAEVSDFLETIIRNTQSAIQMGIKNTAGQKAVNVALSLNAPGQTDVLEPLNYVSTDPNSITILVNGLKKSFKSSDRLWLQAVTSLNLPDVPFMGIFSKPAQLLRTLITKEPGFMLANMIRDSMSSYVTSGVGSVNPATTIRNFAAAIAGKSPEFQALFNAGILGGHEYSKDVIQSGDKFASDLRKTAGYRTANEKVFSPVTGLWEALEVGTTASDAATRMQVYREVLAKTGNEAEAIYRAVEVMNFNRKGNSAIVRVLTAAIPFLNARMQGLDVFYRAAFGKGTNQRSAEEIQKKFFIRGATMMAMSCMYWALTHDDDDYKKQEQETKDNYWLLPSLGIKLPIPFEVGILFKVIPERIMARTFGTDTNKDFTDSMVRQLVNTLSLNPIPQVAKPFIEYNTNYNFFTGRPIVGQGMEGVESGYQTGPNTSAIAADIGKLTGMSPLKLDHLVGGFVGTMGMYAFNLMDTIYKINGDSIDASKRFEQTPVIKRFLIDPEARGTVSAYYEIKNATAAAVRTASLLERTQNFKEWGPYMKEHAKMLATQDYVLDLEKTMKDFREMKMLIRASKMDPDKKRDALLGVTKAENSLTANIQVIKKNIQ